MQTITVEPVEEGWLVRADAIDNEQLFRSGGGAERAARRLARAVAAAGDPVEVLIRLRDGALAARFVHGA